MRARVLVARQAARTIAVRDEVISHVRSSLRAGELLTEAGRQRVSHFLATTRARARYHTRLYTIVKEVVAAAWAACTSPRIAMGRQVRSSAGPHLTDDPMQRERLRREAQRPPALTHRVLPRLPLEESATSCHRHRNSSTGPRAGKKSRRTPARHDRIVRTAGKSRARWPRRTPTASSSRI